MTDPQQSTICAISTPPGAGGIAVVRISGPDATTVMADIWHGARLDNVASHTAHLGRIVNPTDGEEIDTAVATVYRAPRSFTGENTVEISIHGSTWIQGALLRLLIDCGCTMAAPGEFTRRAFANGRLDLAEAEAVADVIASTTQAAHRLAASQMRGDFSRRLAELRQRLLELASLLELELDFSEEDVEFASRRKLLDLATEVHTEVSRLASSFATGHAIRNGIPVAIVGHTNAGKSTLLNRLLNDERAIVSDIQGTTRDTIEDTTTINGTLFRFIDTAGLRHTDDPVETIGINRSISAIARATVAVWVIDATRPETLDNPASAILEALPDNASLIVALNKTDATPPDDEFRCRIADTAPDGTPIIEISATTGTGIDTLLSAITEASGIDTAANADITVTNARHYEALAAATQSTRRIIDGLNSGISGDFIAQDLRQTLHHLGEITGHITTPDILSTIFSHFCIGK